MLSACGLEVAPSQRPTVISTSPPMAVMGSPIFVAGVFFSPNLARNLLIIEDQVTAPIRFVATPGEPFDDQNLNGRYDLGEPFDDVGLDGIADLSEGPGIDANRDNATGSEGNGQYDAAVSPSGLVFEIPLGLSPQTVTALILVQGRPTNGFQLAISSP